ncbi:hypothetical protein R6Q59_029715 [Mikania micrantha]
MMPPKLRQAKNKDGQTPYELFCKENAYLIEDGLKWVKSATIYATLMVTIVVTIAVNSKDYIPESNATNAVKFFLIALIVCFACSSISMLVFLYVLISRQFSHLGLFILPSAVLVGLTTLLMSFMAMILVVIAILHHRTKNLQGSLRFAMRVSGIITGAVTLLVFFLFLFFLTNRIGVSLLFRFFYQKKRQLYNYKCP